MAWATAASLLLLLLPRLEAADDLTGCIVYNRGETPAKNTPLGEGWGWFVVVFFGAFFTIFTIAITRFEAKTLGADMSSEQFNTAGRNVGVGLTAAVIVSQWTWAATLLMSSNMGWRVGVSGPFWYASGATVQILLFAILAIQVKRRASHMHTFMEIVKARFGTVTHIIMIFFALMANLIVTAMLLLGGAATISDLTGMSAIWAAFLIPLLSCWIYTLYGGLKATFFASYVHTTVIFMMLLIFTFSVYGNPNTDSELYGSAGKVYDALDQATVHAFFEATVLESNLTMSTPKFADLGTFMENDGSCFDANKQKTEKTCIFEKTAGRCCSLEANGMLGTGIQSYCRTGDDCIDISSTEHYKSKGCDTAAGERCVTSFLTMGSSSGLLFGITNIVGNFGTVFVDQSYWQSAVAAKPKSAVYGFLLGGMVWFAVPFCMATTNGLVGRALTTEPSLTPLYIDSDASGKGLTPARAISQILGSGGAFILLLQLFMAITSTGSAEIIAVSSILTYDVYYEYINPELKQRREVLRRLFYQEAPAFEDSPGMVPISNVQSFMNRLVEVEFFEFEVLDNEVQTLTRNINSYTANDRIPTSDLYSSVNRAVASNNIEGAILLRVSKFFTGIFAIFMGFLAVFLQALDFGLGWVYMTMGVIIGSAVGPASVTILFEQANKVWVSLGAILGLIMGVLGWVIQALVQYKEVTYDTLGKDWPWVVGNLCAILGGLFIALGGSIAMPDKTFKWEMLNEKIPLVDDVEPPKDAEETDEKLQKQVKIATGASLVLTFILLILWPIPMHLSGNTFNKGGFTFWVIVEIFWAMVGGIAIIGLPVFEVIRDFKKSKAALATVEAGGREKLTNGDELFIKMGKQIKDESGVGGLSTSNKTKM